MLGPPRTARHSWTGCVLHWSSALTLVTCFLSPCPTHSLALRVRVCGDFQCTWASRCSRRQALLRRLAPPCLQLLTERTVQPTQKAWEVTPLQCGSPHLSQGGAGCPVSLARMCASRACRACSRGVSKLPRSVHLPGRAVVGLLCAFVTRFSHEVRILDGSLVPRCTIDWKKGKNVTVKTIKKKQKHKGRGTVRTITKQVPNDSFFNFFSPLKGEWCGCEKSPRVQVQHAT